MFICRNFNELLALKEHLNKGSKPYIVKKQTEGWYEGSYLVTIIY